MGRPIAGLATRFERQVNRTGEHHVWLGGIYPERGTGRINVNRVEMASHRLAWELANGDVVPFAVEVQRWPQLIQAAA